MKGYSVPILLIVMSLLVALPVLFWVASNNFNFAQSADGSVKGTSTSQLSSKPGLGITVTSEGGTWDLVEYACKTLDECNVSLSSGKRLGTVSGGIVENYQVTLLSSTDWDEYSFLKYYVRSAWGTGARGYKVLNAGNLQDSKIYNMTSDDVNYEVVVSPLETAKKVFVKSAAFSDK